MIHATRQVVTHWSSQRLVRREGNLLLTDLDTVVVPDAGYDGSGPPGAPGDDVPPTDAASGSIWAYASDMVFVKRGPVEVIPGPTDEADAAASFREALDRTTNTVVIRAQRMATATFQGCCHGATEIDLTLCGIGGAGS